MRGGVTLCERCLFPYSIPWVPNGTKADSRINYDITFNRQKMRFEKATKLNIFRRQNLKKYNQVNFICPYILRIMGGNLSRFHEHCVAVFTVMWPVS